MKDKDIIVYTCNLGHYDDYRNMVVPKGINIRFIYFTDVAMPVAGWEIRQVDKSIIPDITKLARYYKINSHKVLPSHDYSVWLDSRFDVNIKGVLKFVEKVKEHDVSCFDYPNNPERSLFDEGETCKSSRLDNPSIVVDQMAKYRTEGFPWDKFICATGIMVRKNSKNVSKFNECWWEEVKRFSNRDQLSQMYAAWKTDVDIYKIKEGNVYDNDLVDDCMSHRHKQQNDRRKNRALIDKRYKNERPLKPKGS